MKNKYKYKRVATSNGWVDFNKTSAYCLTCGKQSLWQEDVWEYEEHPPYYCAECNAKHYVCEINVDKNGAEHSQGTQLKGDPELVDYYEEVSDSLIPSEKDERKEKNKDEKQ